MRFRAEHVSDYEALDDIHFIPLSPDPKYIFYIGEPSSYDSWKKISDKKKENKMYSLYEEKIAEIKDSFVESNFHTKNSLWEWDYGSFSYEIPPLPTPPS